MKRSVARNWRKALRSGEFKQTRGALRNKEGYCCLGVLCELYRRETGKGKWRKSIDNKEDFCFLRGEGLPPEEVDEWAGVNSRCYMLPNGSSLDSLNDDGTSFEVIAKIILDNEKEL